MPTDNTTLNPGASGDVIATDDVVTLNGAGSSGVKVQRVKVGFGVDGDFSDASTTNPLPISVNAANFIFSTSNSTVAQLAAGATFTGLIETALNQPSISLLLQCDQPVTLIVRQYIDLAGVHPVKDITFTIPIGGWSQSFPLNGNYIQLLVTNNGTATTTTLDLNTAYGTIPSAQQSGRVPTAPADCDVLLTQTISAAGVSTSFDSNGYASLTAQLTGVWQGNAFFESSNDGVNWDIILVTSNDTLGVVDTITQGGTYTIKPSGRYYHLNTTNITGSIALSVLGRFGTGPSGADYISSAMDARNNTPLNVALQGTKQDASGALILSDGSQLFTGGGSSVAPLVIIDTIGYQSLSAHIIGAYAGAGTVVIEATNDLSGRWLPAICFNVGAWVNNGTIAINSTGTIILVNCSFGRYIRIRISAFSSGVIEYTALLRTAPIPVGLASQSITGSVTVIGTAIVAPVVASNTIVNNGNGASAQAVATTSGATIVEKHAVPELTWLYAAAAGGIVNTTTAVTIKAAVAAQRGNITSIQINAGALGAATEFAIRDGAAGTVLWRISIPTTGLSNQQYTFDPPLRQAAVNTLLEVVTLTATVTGGVYVNAQGFMSN